MELLLIATFLLNIICVINYLIQDDVISALIHFLVIVFMAIAFFR